MREWTAWGSRGAASEPGLNVRFGPFATQYHLAVKSR
jgi:hypothetical protein